jgi:hypothetical protein
VAVFSTKGVKQAPVAVEAAWTTMWQIDNCTRVPSAPAEQHHDWCLQQRRAATHYTLGLRIVTLSLTMSVTNLQLTSP